jgi:hypothetical protein
MTELTLVRFMQTQVDSSALKTEYTTLVEGVVVRGCRWKGWDVSSL